MIFNDGMSIWILAVVVMILTALAGWRLGAIRAAISCASASLIASNAHFDAAYAACGALANRPATLETFTMQPLPRSRIPGATACMQRNAPK